MSDDSKSTVILCKITSQHREQSRECPITLWREANLTKPSNIRLDERLEIDKSNLASSSKIGHLLKFDITQLNKKLNESIKLFGGEYKMKLMIKEDTAGRYEWDEHIDGSYSVRDRFENKYVTAYKVLGKPVRYTIKQSDETDLNYFGQQIPHKYTKHEVEKSIERFGVPEKTFADISESWCDDKLDQLYAKGKENWDQDDWETYAYCQNANAERDYYDLLDEDIEDNNTDADEISSEIVAWAYENFPEVDYIGESSLNNNKGIVIRFAGKISKEFIDKLKEKFGNNISFGTSTYKYAPEIKHFSVRIMNDVVNAIEESTMISEDTNKYEIQNAIAEYTGGGIYVYYGKLYNGNYFLASDDTGSDYIQILDATPENFDISLYPEWQENHRIDELSGKNANEFWNMMLNHIINSKKVGNYDASDLEMRLLEKTNAIIESVTLSTLTEFTNIVFDTLLKNTQYPQLDLDKLNEFDDEMDDFAQVDAKRGKIDIGYDGHIYEISIKELK